MAGVEEGATAGDVAGLVFNELNYQNLCKRLLCSDAELEFSNFLQACNITTIVDFKNYNNGKLYDIYLKGTNFICKVHNVGCRICTLCSVETRAHKYHY